MSAAKANLERLPPSVRVVLVLGLVALAAFPFVGTDFYVQMVTRMMIMAIFAMSLDLLQGVTGLVSLGHAAYFGLAGYALAFLTPAGEPVSLWWTLPVAVLASGLAALVIGFFVVRTHGIYFIMVTLAFAQMVYFVFHDTALGGGSDGLYLNNKPLVGWGEVKLLDLENRTTLYYLVLVLMVGIYLLLRRILDSRFGRALQGIRVNEHRMRAIGFPVMRYQLGVYVLAGVLAGLSGYLSAAQFGFVNPEIISWHQSGAVMMMVILGGMGTLSGSIIGAFVFVLLEEFFKDDTIFGGLARHWQLLMGIIIVAVACFLPRGLVGLAGGHRRSSPAVSDKCDD